MKRILAVILSLMMVFTLLGTAAFAAGGKTNVSFTVDKTTAAVGDTISVTLSNGAMTIESFTCGFTFDKEKLECTSISGPDSSKPHIFKIYDEDGEYTKATATSSTEDSNKEGTVGIAFAGTADVKYKAGVLLTATFRVKATGDAAFTLYEDTGGTDRFKSDSIETKTVTISKAPITTVTASVDAPVKGQPLDTTVDTSGATGYTAAVEWYEGTTAAGSPVTGTAKPSQYYFAKITLTAKPGETFAASLGSTITTSGDFTVTRVSNTELTLTKAYPATAPVTVTKVQIAGTAPTLNVPEAADFGVPYTVTVPRTYSVTVHTDSGVLTNPVGVVWSVSGLEGVTVDPNTGALTISSDCPGGQINLTATYGGVSSTPATPTVFRATSAAKWLKIVDKNTGGAPQTTIIRPVGTESTDMIDIEYEAKVYDQFSQPVTDKAVTWEIAPKPDHMGTLETVGGPYRLLLHVFHNTETIPFTLSAALKAAPTIKDTVTITVQEKTPQTLAVTQADTTYGTPLAAPVFTVPEGTIKTFIHYSTPTSSVYSSATPPTNAGEYVVNIICETDTQAYSGYCNFKIEPKSISNMLQPITDTYTYTGAPQKPEAVVMDGTKKLVEGTDYTVSYGTNVHVFEAATVSVEGKGNYTGTFSRNFKIQPKPIDINSAVAVNRDYEEGRLDVECTVTLPVASDVRQGEHYLVFATMADDTAGTNKTVNVQVRMVKGDRGENYTLNNDTTTATVTINQIDPADPTGLKGVKGQKLSAVELPAGWNWDAPGTVMNTAGTQTFKAHYAGDANHKAVTGKSLTVNVLNKTDVSAFITFPDGEKEYTGSWMKYEEASISGTNLGSGAKWDYVYTAGTGTLMAAGFPEGIGTYTVTVTYEDSINYGIATATLTIVPKKVAIPAADTTVFTYDGNAKTYSIVDTADYTVSGNTQTDAGDHTVTVALKDKATTAWADGTTTDKTYTFTIKQATPTGEPAYTEITASGKTLADANLTKGTITPDGTIKWNDAETTVVEANKSYGWTFTPTNPNYTTLTGSIELYHKSSSGGGGVVGVTTYSITVKSAKNGDVTASHKSASKGTTVTLTVDPDKGYVLDTLTVLDGKDKEIKLTEKNGKYTFTMPSGKVTVEAMFEAEQPTGKNPFIDVPAGSYYEDAVIWAVDKGITTGTGNGRFSPDAPCTRAQIVTFLWRAAGSPAPKSMSSFSDVPAEAFYAKAVAWAVEKGITSGTGDGKFSPDATCTRAQAVTFLYRANGSPAVSGNSAFTDVAADAYYAAAVKWAEKNGITGGIGGGLFGSDNNCTRAQIVTFLYRSVK